MRKVNDKEPHVKIGDMVIVKKEGTARCFWKIENYKQSATTLRRLLQLLVPRNKEYMEITAKEYKSNNDELSARTKLNRKATEFKPCRVRRQAAVAGNIKRRNVNS